LSWVCGPEAALTGRVVSPVVAHAVIDAVAVFLMVSRLG
jgi:hypothetical protein